MAVGLYGDLHDLLGEDELAILTDSVIEVNTIK